MKPFPGEMVEVPVGYKLEPGWVMVEIPEGEPPPGGRLIGKAMYFGETAQAASTVLEWARESHRYAVEQEHAARLQDREMFAKYVEEDMGKGRVWACQADANRHDMALKEIAFAIRSVKL